MIHINENMEGSLNEVLANTNIKSDSLAILSVLVKKQKSDNGMLKNLFDAVADVKTENLTKDFNGVKLSHLLPRNTNGFYRYNGSLTYPNCTEAAIWTVFKVLSILICLKNTCIWALFDLASGSFNKDLIYLTTMRSLCVEPFVYPKCLFNRLLDTTLFTCYTKWFSNLLGPPLHFQRPTRKIHTNWNSV